MIHSFGFHNRRQQWGKKGAKKEYRKEGRKLIVLRIYYSEEWEQELERSCSVAAKARIPTRQKLYCLP